MLVKPRWFVTTLVRNHDDEWLTLFLKQKKERPWRFAGGKIEPGELPVKAASRELREETGLKPTFIRFLDVDEPQEIDGGVWQGMYFLADTIGEPHITETEKISQFSWFTRSQLVAVGSRLEAAIVEKVEKWGI